MIFRLTIFTILAFFLSLEKANAFFNSPKRSYLYSVGSSTVSPLMAAVSEEFSRTHAMKNSPIQTPLVESTGSISGFKLFCGGIGYKYPDFVNASRPIEISELENCQNNGVKKIIEIKIGYDGIVIANAKGSKKMNLSKEQIFLALAEKIYDKTSGQIINNPYKTWNQIDSKLPKAAIIFYGPPATSGTRDIFVDMTMESFCMNKKEFIAAYPGHNRLKTQCHKIRNDGVFIESGENDDFIVRALKNHPYAMGIFGFNFLAVNPTIIQPVKVDNIAPNYENIASKKYELARPLFIYFKKEHLNLMPDMRDFIKEIISSETIGRNGYLVHNGLVALSDAELQQIHANIIPQLQ